VRGWTEARERREQARLDSEDELRVFLRSEGLMAFDAPLRGAQVDLPTLQLLEPADLAQFGGERSAAPAQPTEDAPRPTDSNARPKTRPAQLTVTPERRRRPAQLTGAPRTHRHPLLSVDRAGDAHLQDPRALSRPGPARGRAPTGSGRRR
jgi:hypothetical protein